MKLGRPQPGTTSQFVRCFSFKPRVPHHLHAACPNLLQQISFVRDFDALPARGSALLSAFPERSESQEESRKEKGSCVPWSIGYISISKLKAESSCDLCVIFPHPSGPRGRDFVSSMRGFLDRSGIRAIDGRRAAERSIPAESHPQQFGFHGPT